jgi:hypothetical protein
MEERQVYYLILHVGGTTSKQWPNEKSSIVVGKGSRAAGIPIVSPKQMFTEARKSVKSVGVYLHHIPIR